MADRTVAAYETGWSSFAITERAMGWRLKVAEDLNYERLITWQRSLKEVGKKEWTART